jgi:hypothetical protein
MYVCIYDRGRYKRDVCRGRYKKEDMKEGWKDLSDHSDFFKKKQHE